MKKFKLFTLGLIMCCSLAMFTGCGNNNDGDNNQTENDDTTDDKNNDVTDDDADNDTTRTSNRPAATGDDNVGEDIVDTVDDVGTDIVDGVTDVGRDMTDDDGTGNNADNNTNSAAPATTTP